LRQHVNPLSQFFQLPLSLPSKNVLFRESHYPIHLDIGSAKGEFLIELATRFPEWNFLGLEIESLLLAYVKKRKKNLN
jgi:Predicted S-adenosylmethionine-dependent methyltransferase